MKTLQQFIVYVSQSMSDFLSLFFPQSQLAFAGAGGMNFGRFFAEGDGGDGGNGDGNNGGTPSDKGGGSGEPSDKGGGKKEDDMIPSYRLREETEKRKTIEAELAKYKQKEAEYEDAKRKEEEEKQKKAGEYEKVIQTKDEELAQKKAEREKLLSEKKLWDERNKAQDERNKTKLEEVKKTLGEEKFKKFESFLTGVEDPFDKASKIEDALELFGTKEGGKGGSGVPDNGGNAGKIAEFKSRLEKGEALSPNERQEYIKLLSEKK